LAKSPYLRVADAQVEVVGAASLQKSSFIEDDTMSFPSFKIKLVKADFVQVMRCAASYQIKTLTGSPLKNSPITISRDDQKWAWTQAANQKQNCRMVGSYIVENQVEDIAVTTGSYYYALNPCIAAEHSDSGNPECSYNVSFTEVVTAPHEYSSVIRDRSQALTQAQGELNAATENAVMLAQKIALHLRACEDLLSHDRNMLDFREGVIKISAMVIGGGLAYAGTGNPNMAVMGAMMIGQMGGMLVATKVFKFPQGRPEEGIPAIPNECVQPCALPENAKEPSCAGTVTSNTRYEGEFHVQALVKELSEYLGESGEIAKKQIALVALLKEMGELNQKIETIDEALKEASKAGLDINDPTTYPTTKA
jgi:hypothetical protein